MPGTTAGLTATIIAVGNRVPSAEKGACSDSVEVTVVSSSVVTKLPTNTRLLVATEDGTVSPNAIIAACTLPGTRDVIADKYIYTVQ